MATISSKVQGAMRPIIQAKSNAKEKWGRGWDMLTEDMKMGLVSAELLVIFDLGEYGPERLHETVAQFSHLRINMPERITD